MEQLLIPEEKVGSFSDVSFELRLKDWRALARLQRKTERPGTLSRGSSVCKGTGSCPASGAPRTLWGAWWEA